MAIAAASAEKVAGAPEAGRIARCICRGERGRGGCMAMRGTEGRGRGWGSVVWTAGRDDVD